MPRTLFIDADACPVTRESIDCARRAGVAVVIAGNSTQNLERHIRRDDPRDAEHARRGFWVTTLDVSVGADSADFAIVERLQAGDRGRDAGHWLGEHGARARCRRHRCARARVRQGDYRYAAVYSPRGKEGTPRRRTHSRSAAFTSEDRARFKRNLTELLH